MKNPGPGTVINRYFQLLGLDLGLGVLFLLLVSINPSARFFIRMPLSRLLLIAGLAAAAGGFWLGLRLIRKSALEEKIRTFLSSSAGQIGSLLFFGSAFVLLLLIPAQGLAVELFGGLLCLWLIGAQTFLLFPFKAPDATPAQDHKTLAAISLLGIYAFLAIPARLPGFFDGLPWNTPAEFIFAALLIPLSALLYWRIYARKTVVAAILLLMILRAGSALLIPQTGLGLRVFRSSADASSGNWYATYSTVFEPAYSDIMKAPYQSLFEFPATWLTRQELLSTPKPLLQIHISGYARLEPGEKLVFSTQGLVDGKIQFLDVNSGTGANAQILNNGAAAQGNGPDLQDFSINGDLSFKNDRNYQLNALIVKPDQTSVSAFDSPKVWVDASVFQLQPILISIAGWLAALENLVLAALVGICLLLGLREIVLRSKLLPVDVFLGVSGTAFLGYLSRNMAILPLPHPVNGLLGVLQLSAMLLIGLNCAVSLLARHRSGSSPDSTRGFLLSCGLVVLGMFLLVYADSLRQFTVFSRLDDPFEYQSLARGIFINQDFLNLQTPPHAYKFLFPYLAGGLHLLFGESSSAQYYLNAWCSMLTAMLLIKMLPKPGREAAAGLLLLLLFGNYFFLYFGFGLIEPVAVLCLAAFYYMAQKQNSAGLLLTGILTLLLRMDYVGAVLTGLVLGMPPVYGSFREAWGQVLGWAQKHWARLGIQATILLAPCALVIATYSLLIAHYRLGDADTANNSLATILDGLMRVVFGGTAQELRGLFQDFPLFTSLTTLVLVGGSLLGLGALLLRFKLLRNVDLRWGLIIAGLLAVYLIVHPTGYPPRFSTPLLPIVLLLLASFAIQLLKAKQTTNQGVS